MKYPLTASYVKAFRKTLGLTQKQLGQKLGMHPQYVSNIERATASLPAPAIRKLTNKYNGFDLTAYMQSYALDRYNSALRKFKK